MPNRFEAEKKKRTAALAKLLAGEPEGKSLVAFAEILFERVAGEDFVEYDPPALAALVKDAFDFFRHRAGPTAVRIGGEIVIDRGNRTHTVIELSTTNRPFIFDSVLGEFQALGHSVRLVVHPIIDVRRDTAGTVVEFSRPKAEALEDWRRESFVHVHVPLVRDLSQEATLTKGLTSLLSEVQVATDDWGVMRARLRGAITDFGLHHPDLPPATIEETVAFLQWLDEGNFVFLGMREYSYSGALDEPVEQRTQSAGLGLLRDPTVTVLRRGTEAVTLTPEIRAFLTSTDPLIVTKANVHTRVHRRDYMDYIGIKIFESGKVKGELRIVGLFTSTAFTRSAERIPLIRRKVTDILKRAGFDAQSHSGKALINILEHYPRTELFQAESETLFESALAILQLEERPRVRALPRRDRFDRFVSVLVFVPRDRYSSDLRERIGQMLAEIYDGRGSAFFPDFSMTHLTRVQFIIGRNPGEGPDPTQDEIESRIRAIVRTFEDDLLETLNERHPPQRVAEVLRDYEGAFGSDYRVAFRAEDALLDVEIAERLALDDIEVRFFRSPSAPETEVTMSFHHLGDPIALSRRVPLLENLGFAVIDERTYCIARKAGPPLYRHDMILRRGDRNPFDLAQAASLHDAVLAVWHDRAENDGFNALVLLAALPWRRAALLRTIARYLRQTGIPYSLDYLWGALRRYPAIAARLVDLFVARFEPGLKQRERTETRIAKEIEAALEAVTSLDDDTILRAFRQVIEATQRTDYFAVDGDAEPAAITLKINPRELPFVPAPRPFREIFVHSPKVDGLHLRFGPVARGGLRWSDRPQDFRTEILGLVKAQQVKNAVIVPVGAKGGFVPARLPSTGRDKIFEAGRRAYIRFVDRLLSVTDDIDGDAVVPPKNVVRHDGDDPYLVVADDKGTATFSDTANSIALKRGFWLGDAFASGGSAGYDHKAMGITARGAWEAVKRHFREIDVDIQSEPFTVAGVGDMSGDVFGNGMLLSPCIKLAAAFDHRDIFIDPDPDPARSLEERKRLFALPRSSWQDYERALISKGGGVFSRAEKQIALSPEMKKLLKLNKASAQPSEILSAILRAPVDLLWFGGIGTYVRGPDETNADVGDKANDAIRISATEIGAKVVGEGANLGMTPKARIAYGLKGGRCNSDAIDNSAGVNTSDVEVNIKIALSPAVRSGKLDEPGRLDLLRSMTDDVAKLVLRNNYQQTLALSLEASRGLSNLGNQLRLVAELEERGLLDRTVEGLPDNATIEARAAGGQGFTRSEIGTLLAFAKIALSDDIRESAVPDDPYLSRELFRYFPAEMRERFPDAIASHRLRREIIATQLANAIINRGGSTMVARLVDQTGADAPTIAAAYAATRDSFGLTEMNAAIDALDDKVPGQVQLRLYGELQDVLMNRIVWFIRNVDFVNHSLDEIIGTYQSGVAEVERHLKETLSPESLAAWDARTKALVDEGTPEELARRIAALPDLVAAPDIVQTAQKTGKPVADIARTHFALEASFRLGALIGAAQDIPVSDYFDRLALDRAIDSIAYAHRGLTAEVSSLDLSGAEAVRAWSEKRGADVNRIRSAVDGIVSSGLTLSKITVAASLLGDLARMS